MAVGSHNASESDSRVRILDDAVVNLIAAGEVVERPVSIVRELVDNAIDAGATSIEIELEEGGIALIRITDNGSGMSRGDARCAILRHATSKLSSAEELDSISTLGFRGEALAAIAAISRMTLGTRRPEAPHGVELRIVGGQVEEECSITRQPGTTIEVRNIFFNTPARKKFLKLPRTEEQRVKSWLALSALAHPTVQFRLSGNGRELLSYRTAASFLERAQSLVQGSCMLVRSEHGPVRVEGYVAHPAFANSRSQSLSILVNRRLVHDRLLSRAVKDGFDSMLKGFEHPIGILSVTLPTNAVDVNVHPQKSEVRFRSPPEVFLAVRSAVLAAVREFRSPVSLPSHFPRSSERPEVHFFSGIASPLTQQVRETPMGSVHTDESVGSRPPELFKAAELRPIGQALGCYVLAEGRGALFVIDMHAAHERITFNRVRKGFQSRSLPTQKFLLPTVVTLAPEAIATVLEHQELLKDYGIHFSADSETSLSVTEVPALLQPSKIAALLEEIGGAEAAPIARGRVDEWLDHVAARIACHASVRSGDVLSQEEMTALLEEFDASELAGACPHGRPVIVRFSEGEIERWFGRDT